MGKLTARKVETAKPGKYGDGGGLQLAVAAARAKKWVLRFLWQGKAREMGLGSYPEVKLAEAREKAMAGRRLARSGIDPIAERKQDKRVPTFGKLADEVVAEQSKGFRNEKHKAQWAVTLRVCRAVAAHAGRRDHDRRCPGRAQTNLDDKDGDRLPPSRPHRARSERRQSQGAQVRRESCRMARPSREPSPQAAEAHARPPRRHALPGHSGLCRQTSDAQSSCRIGPGVRHSHRGAIGRSARRAMERGRLWREDLDDSASADEGGSRAPRPSQRVSVRNSRKVRRGASLRVHIPWPGGRQAARGDGPPPDAASGRRCCDSARLPIELPRLGGQRDTLPARARRSCPCACRRG